MYVAEQRATEWQCGRCGQDGKPTDRFVQGQTELIAVKIIENKLSLTSLRKREQKKTI